MLENSVVMFTSDHGDCLGDHGLVEKWNMYNSSVRVPLVVWSPERYQGSRMVDALTQWFDIGPTILDLAGATTRHAHGSPKFTLPFLENEDEAERRRYVFSEHAPDLMLQNVGYLYMVRDERYKLVDYRGMGEGQLFDLESDPDETVDLWRDPEHKETRQRLQGALDDWLVSSTSLYGGWWLKA